MVDGRLSDFVSDLPVSTRAACATVVSDRLPIRPFSVPVASAARGKGVKCPEFRSFWRLSMSVGLKRRSPLGFLWALTIPAWCQRRRVLMEIPKRVAAAEMGRSLSVMVKWFMV